MTETTTSIDETNSSIDATKIRVHAQHGTTRPEVPKDLVIDELARMRADLPETLSAEAETELLERAATLDPWLQGPFWLGGQVVIGGTWRCDLRWKNLGAEIPKSLAGQRVIDVGSNAGYDPFMFKARGADHVVACEPYHFIEQARFLDETYRSGVEFRQIGWQGLDATELGTFDLLHCHGVLYHEPHPMLMLERLKTMIRPGGTMYFGSMMLADPSLAEYARYVPNAYFGDDTWWWVPGRLAMRWMLETAGFQVIKEFGLGDGPPGEFPTCNAYFHAVVPE